MLLSPSPRPPSLRWTNLPAAMATGCPCCRSGSRWVTSSARSAVQAPRSGRPRDGGPRCWCRPASSRRWLGAWSPRRKCRSPYLRGEMGGFMADSYHRRCMVTWHFWGVKSQDIKRICQFLATSSFKNAKTSKWKQFFVAEPPMFIDY